MKEAMGGFPRGWPQASSTRRPHMRAGRPNASSSVTPPCATSSREYTSSHISVMSTAISRMLLDCGPLRTAAGRLRPAARSAGDNGGTVPAMPPVAFPAIFTAPSHRTWDSPMPAMNPASSILMTQLRCTRWWRGRR
ncbi:hypothetical protein SAMN05442782_0411 [Streptomyces sp. OK228]|nr:hypothetical protein SAMN05442782_0411 [Streptomyces sp. OK228]